MRYVATILLLAAIMAAPGCRPKHAPQAGVQPPARSAEAVRLNILADPVLAEPLAAVSKLLKQNAGIELKLSYLDSTAMARLKPAEVQDADVLVFADHDVLMSLVKSGLVDESSACVFAGDRLTLVGKSGVGWRTGTLFDTYKLRFKAIGLTEPTTVLGFFCDEALKSDGAYKRIKDRIKYFPTTPEMLQALAANKVQLAMTYASMAAQDDTLEVALLVGADLHEDIRYRAVARAGCAADRGVQRLLKLLCEDGDVQSKLGSYGLADRKTVLTEVR